MGGGGGKQKKRNVIKCIYFSDLKPLKESIEYAFFDNSDI